LKDRLGCGLGKLFAVAHGPSSGRASVLSIDTFGFFLGAEIGNVGPRARGRGGPEVSKEQAAGSWEPEDGGRHGIGEDPVAGRREFECRREAGRALVQWR